MRHKTKKKQDHIKFCSSDTHFKTAVCYDYYMIVKELQAYSDQSAQVTYFNIIYLSRPKQKGKYYN